MAYLAFIRTRRVLIGVAYAVVAILVLAQLNDFADHRMHGVVQMQPSDGILPLWIFIAGAAFLTAIVSTILGTTLQRERSNYEIAWTLPRSRTQTAVTIVAVNIGGLAVAYAFLCLAVVVQIIGPLASGAVRLTTADVPIAVFGFAYAVLWYALIQAATSWYSERGGVIAGLSWPAFFIATTLAQSNGVPVPIERLLYAFNTINPLAYLAPIVDALGKHGTGVPPSQIVLGSTAAMFGLAVVALAIAVAGWRRAIA